MADTGSTDGSREIAEKYADIVFDFPWINDFSAARNAVMDRCSGTWYFSVDCDEWLDGELSRIAIFAMSDKKHNFATINVHSFLDVNSENSESYSEFYALRLLRMSTGRRYQGTIHEYWELQEKDTVMCIEGVTLLHDGYVPEIWKAKGGEARNMALLKEQVENDMENLRCHIELVESCSNMGQKMEYCRRALNVLKSKPPQWKLLGPPLLRHCVNVAVNAKAPELLEWVEWAEDWFPDSLYVTIDVAFCACCFYWNNNNYTKTAEYGKKYLKGIERFNSKGANLSFTILCGAMIYTVPVYKQQILMNLAASCAYIGQPQEAMKYARLINGVQLNKTMLGRALYNLQLVHSHTELNIAPLIYKLWNDIQIPKPNEKTAKERLEQFTATAKKLFTANYWQKEEREESFTRHGCLALKDLAGKHPLGDAAVLLEETDPIKLENHILSMKDWRQIPPTVFAHAIKCGMRFPLPGIKLPLEHIRNMAANLLDGVTVADSQDIVRRAAQSLDEPNTLIWAQMVITIAVDKQKWGKNVEDSWGLCQDFVKIERRYIDFYYSKNVLDKKNILFLPSVHRLGWYCCKAFDEKLQGNLTGYVSWLRECLEAVPQMNEMISFLLDRAESEVFEKQTPSAELLVLAKKVKAILSQYAPDDPAVLELKNSPAYQNVAPYLV